MSKAKVIPGQIKMDFSEKPKRKRDITLRELLKNTLDENVQLRVEIEHYKEIEKNRKSVFS